MAQMLEALDVQVGQRVLEIGTGTGYNAAILTELVEDPTLVTTVDIDGDLVDRARQLLQRVVGQVYVNTRDGTLGEASRAPYDRIIVTASVSSLPREWYKQLVPRGRLVVPLQGSLGDSGFLVMEKASDGQSALGQFLVPPLHFMPLRTPEISPLISARELFQQPIESEVQIQQGHRFLALLQNYAFRWFVQWWWSGSVIINQATLPNKAHIIILMDQSNQTILQLKQHNDGWWRGKQHGGFPLWETIEQAIEQFSALGEPEHWLYQVQMDEQEARLQISEASGQAHFICDLYQR
jgi:protein-L-isoaspartate O-methyltransferase